MNDRISMRLALLAAASAALPATAAAQTEYPGGSIRKIQFRVLSAIPGTEDLECGAMSVTRDGERILGFASSPRTRAAREAVQWGPSGAAQGLGTLATLNLWGETRGASPAGDFLVGATSEANRMRAFVWTESSGLVGLTELVDATGSEAFAASANGQTIVGTTDFIDVTSADSPILLREATVWHTGVPTGLGTLSGGLSSEASDVSADGAVVVGVSDIPGGWGDREAFRWTATTGMVGLGDIPGGFHRSVAVNVSDDGSVISGWGFATHHPFQFKVWRWTPQGGIASLGVLNGDFNSKPVDMTPDGNVIVGWSGAGGGFARRPMIWDATHGLRDLMEVLEDGGVDLSEWRNDQGYSFMEATGVSADGKTIVGKGRRDNFMRGWVAVLP